MWVIGKASRRPPGRPCRIASATGTAASPNLVDRGFWAQGRTASPAVPHFYLIRANKGFFAGVCVLFTYK